MGMRLLFIFPLMIVVWAGADADLGPVEGRPAFTSLETPWEVTGQVGGGLLGALALGWIGGGIGASRAHKACLERIDPDFSDECAWSSFGGAVTGFLIGAPIGHALGTLAVGSLQGKYGAPVAAL